MPAAPVTQATLTLTALPVQSEATPKLGGSLEEALGDILTATTLLVLVDTPELVCNHPLLVHAQARTESLFASKRMKSVCICCPNPKDLAGTLKDAGWRFARQGQRLFERVLVVCHAEAEAAVREQLLAHAIAALGYTVIL